MRVTIALLTLTTLVKLTGALPTVFPVPSSHSNKLGPSSQVGDPAKSCNSTVCKLPSCLCASVKIPGGLKVDSIPQIVMFSFDDDLRIIDYERFYSKAFNSRKNPNGCQIGLTFFVSHNYTNYALVEDLHFGYGYEMADHSVDHREPTTWWENATEEEWTRQVLDQRAILEKWANLPTGEVKGFRAPFLVTSETEIKVLHENKFVYEASMGTQTNYWPFTLDYKSPICDLPATCPINSYPGLWLVPNVNYKQKSGYPCSMLDACTSPQTEEEWLDFFMENFNAHYNDNRSPFGIYSHSAWFYYGPQRLSALASFLDKLSAMKDVYLVTHSQMLDWVRNPTTLDKIADFEPWKCPPRPPARCNYQHPSCQKSYGDFSMESCTTPCPPNYPGYGNPNGN